MIESKSENSDIFGLEKGSYFDVSRGGVLFRCITVLHTCIIGSLEPRVVCRKVAIAAAKNIELMTFD